MTRTLLTPAATAAGLLVVVFSARAQTPASMPASGTYTQNFDLLRQNNASPASTTMGGVLNSINTSPFTASPTPNALDGWRWRTGTGTANSSFRRDDGSASAGGGYSYGSAFNTGESALGVLTLNNTGSYFGLILRNDTGVTQSAVTVSYFGEQWRFGGRTDGSADSLLVRYQVGTPGSPVGDVFGPAQGTAAPGLNFQSIVTSGQAGALDGNASANRQQITSTITFDANGWQSGQNLVFVWYDQNANLSGGSGLNDGLAIDDLTILIAPVPEPTGLLAAGMAVVAAARSYRRLQNGRPQA